MDRNRRWTTADGDRGWMTGDGSRLEMNRERQWIATGYGWMTEVNNRRWIPGDGSRKRMTINPLPFYEDIVVIRRYTILEITSLISNYEVSTERRYACVQRTGGMSPPSTRLTTVQSTSQGTIQRYRIKQLHARVTMPSTIPDQIPSHTATMPIPHIMKPYEISLWRSNDL